MVNFNQIPDNVLVPLFYAEVDGSQAGSFRDRSARLAETGPMLDTCTASASELVLIPSVDAARELPGAGSILSAMVTRYRAGDGFRTLWARYPTVLRSSPERCRRKTARENAVSLNL